MDSFDIGTGSPLAASVRKKHTKALLKYIVIVVFIFIGVGLYLLFVPLEIQAQAQGEVQAYHATQVYAPRGGLVKEVMVGCGQEVSEGQALAILECPVGEDVLDEARQEMERYRQELQALQAMAGDLRELFQSQDHQLREELRERLLAFEVETNQAVARVEERIAGRQKPTVTLRAPVNGILTEWEIMPGDSVADAKPVARILRNDVVRIEARVAEGEISDVEVGQKADVRFAVKPWRQHGVFEGTVVDIGTRVQEKRKDGIRHCAVSILVEKAPSNVIEGSTAEVRIKTSEDSPIQRLLGG